MKLSVVIPAYNEEKDIREAIRDVIRFLPDAEIIVVNDASTDNTLGILETINHPTLRVITNNKNMGHGYSVVRGLKEAQGDYILYIDADRQIDLGSVSKVSEGNDFTSGWRTGRQDKLFRKMISFCLKMTNLIFHRMYIKDANCPFKLYRREALLPLLDRLPETYVVPIACLEVLARRSKLKTTTIQTPHKPYEGVRQGFLQLPNRAFFKFVEQAFKEVSRL